MYTVTNCVEEELISEATICDMKTRNHQVCALQLLNSLQTVHIIMSRRCIIGLLMDHSYFLRMVWELYNTYVKEKVAHYCVVIEKRRISQSLRAYRWRKDVGFTIEEESHTSRWIMNEMPNHSLFIAGKAPVFGPAKQSKNLRQFRTATPKCHKCF